MHILPNFEIRYLLLGRRVSPIVIRELVYDKRTRRNFLTSLKFFSATTSKTIRFLHLHACACMGPQLNCSYKTKMATWPWEANSLRLNPLMPHYHTAIHIYLLKWQTLKKDDTVTSARALPVLMVSACRKGTYHTKILGNASPVHNVMTGEKKTTLSSD